MLKLQKTSSDRQISVIVRDKEYFFTQSFLLAFGLALAFHFLFLVIFHVGPIKLRWNETIFPPVQVEADGFKDIALTVDVKAPKNLSNGLPPIKPSMPLLPEQPIVSITPPTEYIKENIGTRNPFNEIEKRITQPTFNPLKKQPSSLVEMLVSGPLANLELLTGLPQTELPPHLKNLIRNKERRIIYNVLVEGHTGKIFWHEALEQTSIASLDQYAEVLLQNIAFVPQQKIFVTAGEVELHFNGVVHD